MKIPFLTARDVEARVQMVRDKGCSVLLYKDARVDMRILDEVFGPLNWQRRHEAIDGKLTCIISVWDEDKKQWIEKQDVGVESNTEATKGMFSDSFKRAGFNLGIGRELYDTPFIWITLTAADFNDQHKLKTKFHVIEMQYNADEGMFDKLAICDDNGTLRWQIGKKVAPKETKQAEKKKAEPKKEKPVQKNRITPDQAMALIKQAEKAFGDKDTARDMVINTIGAYGYERTTDILTKDYNEILDAFSIKEDK